MKENDIIEMYIATIKVGDKYHPEGEEIRVSDFSLDEVLKNGLRLRCEDPEFRDDISVWHWYPVYITKKTYRLDLIGSETMVGGDRSNRPGWEDEIKKETIDYGGGRYN